jgi:hypothetical protein
LFQKDNLKVFISFTEQDHRLVHSLSAALVRMGITPVVATSQFAFGVRLDEKVRKLIRGSDAIVVILTPKGTKSKWVQQEIGCAKAFGKQIVPIKTRGVKVPGMLVGLEYLEFKLSDPTIDLAKVAAYLGDEADRRGIELRKTNLRKNTFETIQFLHLDWPVVCRKCHFADNHVAVCMLDGDWLCMNCGEVVPPSSRP